MNSVTVDARGLSCPEPAMQTRETLKKLMHGTVIVLVDSVTSRDNVIRTAKNAGWSGESELEPDGSFRITLSREEGQGS